MVGTDCLSYPPSCFSPSLSAYPYYLSLLVLVKWSHTNKKAKHSRVWSSLIPIPALQLWVVCSVCPAVPPYREEELSMRLCTWHLVFLEGFQTPLPAFCIYSNSISIILLPSFTLCPCLYSSICQELSPARSQLVYLWSYFALVRSVRTSMVGHIHLGCTLWLLFSTRVSSPSPTFLSLPPPSWGHYSCLWFGWCYQPTVTAYKSQGL